MKTIKNKRAYFTTKWIAYTAMLTALVVATSFIPAPYIPPFGNLYWCDSVIFLAAYLLDPLAAFVTGGLGTFLFDVIRGNAAMMFPSLIIHGLQAAAVSALLHFVFAFLPKKLEPLWAAVSSIVGGIIVIAGYFILRRYINGYALETCGYKAVANVIQEIVGITLAMIICYATTFKKQLAKNGLLPEFKREVLQKQNGESGKTDPETCEN